MNKEYLVDVEDDLQNLEGFNSIKDIGSPDSFRENKCPIKLGENYFGYSQKKFKISKLCKPNYKSLLNYSIIPIYLTIVFYLLLTGVILTGDTETIVHLVLIYIIASFYQLATFPNIVRYNSKEQFEKYLNEYLNSNVTIKLKEEKNIVELPIEFTTDITGEIGIPDNIHIIRLEEVQYFIDSKIKNLIKKFDKAYGNYTISFIHIYNNSKFKSKTFYYWIDSNKKSTNINFISLILSIFLLHWIKAIYMHCSSRFNYVTIYPAKLLSRDASINSNSKLNIHGNIYRPERNNVQVEITEEIKKGLDKLEQDYNKEMSRIEKEKKARQKKQEEIEDRKRNTETLSDFSTNLYKFKIKRVYNKVEARIKFPHYKKIIKPLGKYDPTVKEEFIEEGSETVVIPNGYNIKIFIKRYEDSIDIKFGDFLKNFIRYD